MKFRDTLNEGSLWDKVPDNGKKALIQTTKKPKFKKLFDELKSKKEIRTNMLDTFNISMDSFLAYA